MLIFLFSSICFALYANGIAAQEKSYLTPDDFARAKELPSTVPNGTISCPTNDYVEPSSKRSKRSVWKFTSWPNARVPYTLSDKFDKDQRAVVAKAFQNYHSKTCVRFVQKLSTDKDYVEISRDDNTCGLAELCKKGGPQFAKFGGTCINSGVMTHELGHTLCFAHEQTRTDRDDYISWDTKKCTPHEKDNADHFTTQDLLYDYVSLQHYEGECYNGCIIPKIPGVTKCGSGGELSVLDAEKINAFYKCGGCYSYRFRPISQLKKDENVVGGGISIYNETLCPCRGYHNGDIIPGKGNVLDSSCHVSYNGREYRLDKNFEILTNPKKVKINWKKRPSDGSLPSNAIPGGRTAEREPLYIGRCTKQFDGKTTTLIGKIRKSAPKSLYVPYGGMEHVCNDFEILVCG